jgi:CheY-like chemotaxis protein
MQHKLNCIMLIDDSAADNRYHKMVLEGMNIANRVEVANDCLEAIQFLETKNQDLPDLIFLDLNMPKMNGWEFLDTYKQLGIGTNSKPIVTILTTSENPADQKRANDIDEVKGFFVKPLSEDSLNEIIERYFSENL